MLSAQGDFECAYSNYAFQTGHLSGELIGAQSSLNVTPIQTRNIRPIDGPWGESGCGSNFALYTPLSTARFMADDALRAAIGQRAAEAARRRFALDRQVDDYLDFYAAAMDDFREWRQEIHRV